MVEEDVLDMPHWVIHLEEDESFAELDLLDQFVDRESRQCQE